MMDWVGLSELRPAKRLLIVLTNWMLSVSSLHLMATSGKCCRGCETLTWLCRDLRLAETWSLRGILGVPAPGTTSVSSRRICLHSTPPHPPITLRCLLSLLPPSLLFWLQLSPPLPELHRRQVRFFFCFFFLLQVSSAALLRCARHSCFHPSLRDVSTFSLDFWESGGGTMKKFVTIVLRGLVTLSKESPIWAKEHNRPLKKDTRKKRRAAKRAKAVGRRSLVRAVGISPLVHHLDHRCLRRYCLVV